MLANTCYIYVRGEYVREREILEAAIKEAYEAKLIGKNNTNGWDFDVYVHHGGGASYLRRRDRPDGKLRGQEGSAARETAVSGEHGIYGCPTTVNNVETIAVVGTILRRGADWFAKFGTEKSTGVKLFAGSGHIKQALRSWRMSWASPWKQLIEDHFGGVRGGLVEPQGRDPGRHLGPHDPRRPVRRSDHDL